VRLFRSPRADSIRARERALSNRPDIWLQSKSKQNHQHIALQTGVGPYMCKNKNPPRCKSILQNSDCEISQIRNTLGIFGSFRSICRSAEGFYTVSAITCRRRVEMAAIELTMRLESNIGPHALMIRCSNCFANLRYPNPASRTLTLSHRHEMACLGIYADKYRRVHKDI
jgi:hypothetical protein